MLKIGCCDALFSGFIVDLFSVVTVRQQAITIKRDPLVEVLDTVSVNPGSFLFVGLAASVSSTRLPVFVDGSSTRKKSDG